MRWVGLVLLVAAASTPSFGAKPATIAQLEQFLTTANGKSDADFAWQLADFQLTERMSADRLTTLQKKVPGEQSRRALIALADESAFFAPPAAEIPARPAPTLAEQKHIMDALVGYVKNAIPQLPNFIATRDTDRFEDTPLLQFSDAPFIPFQPLHFVGRSEATVVYRGGRDIATPVTVAGKKPPTDAPGLTTWGVFGPILGAVLVDAAQSTLAWDRWESGADGPIAVFRFAVPRSNSHYEVNYCCVADPGSTRPNGVPFRQMPGYHGELAVDPATGTVVRLMVVAELKSTDPVSDAAILVEYGRVEIGGKSYVCPLRSLSRSHAQEVQVDPVYHRPLTNQVQPVQLSLNESTFRDYHVFRSEARIVESEASAVPAATTAPASAAANPGEAATVAPIEEPAVPVTGAQATPAPPAVPTAADLHTPGSVQGDAATELEVRVRAAEALPGDPMPGKAAQNFTIRTTTRLVDVAVVVYDRAGRPVTDLKIGDLEIFDNGRKQEIRSFNAAGTREAVPSPGVAAAAAEMSPEPEFTNRAQGAKARRVIGATVLLIDAANLAFSDWRHARAEMLRFLQAIPADEPVGLYVLRSRGFEILLEPGTEHKRVADTLARWMPTAQDLARAQSEEGRNRQDIEYVHSISDLFYVNGNNANGQFDSKASTDPQLKSEGNNPEQDALATMPVLARHLAAIEGHKSLVWVASDNVLADWTDQAPSMERNIKTAAPMVLRAQEAMNDAHVSIYPLDASQLVAGGVNSAQSQGNVQLTPTADTRTQISIEGAESPQDKQELSELLEKSKHNLYPGRLNAQIKQDLHPIAAEYRELAEATGGRVFRRAGDLAAEMSDVVADGRAAYLLSFAPDAHPDDAYHHITMKLTGGRSGTLRYRTGYLYAKEPETMKDRLNQAIWQPGDTREIALAATPAKEGGAITIHLTLDATDLALAQQGGLWMDKLDLLLVERDDAVLRARINGQTAELRLRPGTFQAALRDGLAISVPAPAVPRGGVLRVIVIDRNSGRTGSVTLPAASLSTTL